MQYRTKSETEWNVRAVEDVPEHKQIVPAQTIVEIVPLSAVLDPVERWDFECCIRNYAERAVRKRDVVLVRVLGWLALMDRCKLEMVPTGPTPTLSAKSSAKPLEVPGLRSRKSAPCATD